MRGSAARDAKEPANAKTVPVPYRLWREDYLKVEAVAALTGVDTNDVLKAALKDWLVGYATTQEYETRHRVYVEEPQSAYDAYIEAGDPYAEAPQPPENPFRVRVARKDGRAGVWTGTIRLNQLVAGLIATKAIYLGISQNDLIVEAVHRWVMAYPHTQDFEHAREAERVRDEERCRLLGVPVHATLVTSATNRKSRTRNTRPGPMPTPMQSAAPPEAKAAKADATDRESKIPAAARPR